MDEKIKRPVLPEMETTDYEAQAEAQIAEAKRQAELQEKRAKRDRDMAIFGDIANLVGKGAAMHGGAWKINKDEPFATKGNERLRALQESNSKQMAEYARMRVAAADANRKQRNAINEAKYNADLAAYKDAVDAAKYAKEQERKDKQDALKEAETASTIAKNQAYINYYNSGGKKTSGGGSGGSSKSTGKTKNMRYLGDWGFDFNSTAEVDEAYARMVQADESKAVTTPSRMEQKGYEVVGDPSTAQKRDALVKGGITKSPIIQWDDENDENNEIDEDFR